MAILDGPNFMCQTFTHKLLTSRPWGSPLLVNGTGDIGTYGGCVDKKAIMELTNTIYSFDNILYIGWFELLVLLVSACALCVN